MTKSSSEPGFPVPRQTGVPCRAWRAQVSYSKLLMWMCLGCRKVIFLFGSA